MKSFAWLLVMAPLGSMAADVRDPAAHTVVVPYEVGEKFDESKAQRFYVDYADFQRLWELAKESRRPASVKEDEAESKAAPEAVVKGILYDAQITAQGLEMVARMEVLTRGAPWAKLELGNLRAAATIKQDEVDVAAAAAVFMVDGVPAVMTEDGAAVLIEKAGEHVVEWRFTVPLLEGWEEVRLLLPEVPATMIRVKSGSGEGVPRLDVPVIGSRGTVVRDETGSSVSAAMGSANRVRVIRQPLAQVVGSEVAPAQAKAENMVWVFPGMERVTSSVEFDFEGTERRQVAVELAGDLQVELVESVPPGVTTLRKEGERQWVEVDFPQAVTNWAKVLVSASREVADLGMRTVPKATGVAARQTGEWSMVGSEKRMVKPGANLGMERVESAKGGRDDAGTFRWRDEQLPQYEVLLPVDRSKAQMEVVYQLSAQKAEMMAAMTLSPGGAKLSAVKVRVPPGYEVQAVSGARIISWHRSEGGLEVLLDDAVESEARLLVHVAKSVSEAAAEWKLEALVPVGFAKVETTALIAAHVADEVKLSFEKSAELREVDVTSVKSALEVVEPLVVKHALVSERSDWSGSVMLTRQAAKFVADAVLLARAGEQGLELRQRIGVEVEQGALAEVVVRLPEQLPEARVAGTGVRDVQTRIEAGMRVYEVRLQREFLQRVDFEMEMELPLNGEVAVPVVQVEGARQVRRFLVVDNAGTREMRLDEGGAVSTAAGSLPFAPGDLSRPQDFRLAAGNGPRVSFTQLESTAGNAAIITLAEITSALRSNGDRWDTVVYSLSNRSLQFLPVKLAEGAELVEVSVGEQAVRADRSSKDAGVYLVPLIQMRAGESSQQVRLVYRLPGKGGDRPGKGLRLDDPQLVGLSAERTLWNVWVPPGFEPKRFDGNMDEIGEEGQALEKQQSLLSEVSRFNRVMKSDEMGEMDKKMALSNAQKAIAKLMEYGEVVSSRGAYESKPRERKGVESKVEQLRGAVQQQLGEQQAILTENRISVENLNFRMDQVKSATREGKDSEWKDNRGASAAAKPMEPEMGVAVNDTTRLKEDFLAKPEPVEPNKKSKGQKPAPAQQQMQVQASNNARATAKPVTELDSAHQGKIAELTKSLKLGYSYANLGDFDNAEKAFTEALKVDPLNGAARRGLEQIESKRAGFFDTARSNQRAAMLNDVNKAWEEQLSGGGVVAATPMDPFSAPAAPAAPAPAPMDPQMVADAMDDKPAVGEMVMALPPSSQLKPVGRVSLRIEVPLEGKVYHFSKLKDHALLELDVVEPWEEWRWFGLWGTLLGVSVLGGMEWRRRRGTVEK
ncbi:hypothetical protein FEM03_01725 [Phragmitibacter flavus]|uniref:Uncharacterized protein n=1 Tax=Phragmitibacter flavus TaxID=2576071 RepID=A0A5R8KKG9_9BACT|nr:tetratricopeptide repeat protein [Phragmitibacter flavus]TLD72816.1 hypothetical protein FEM03_01725 [Phragmitibacter flavus]